MVCKTCAFLYFGQGAGVRFFYLHKLVLCVIMNPMLTLTDKQISPVDMKSRRDLQISSGDTVRVYQKIVEKGKIRLQIFEGVVIAFKHGTEAGATFTVRRVGSDGITVEKIFPLYSPMIDRIEIVRRTRMRRAKLYFLRNKTSKQTREKLRRATMVNESSASEAQRAKEEVEIEESVTENTMDKEEVVAEKVSAGDEAEMVEKQDESVATESEMAEGAEEKEKKGEPEA